MHTFQIQLAKSLLTVQQFLDGHADVVGAVNTTDARHQLDAAVATIDASVDEQGTKHRESRGEVTRRRKLETELIRKYMTPLSKFARAQLQGVPDFAALTPSAGALRTERLVQSGRSMVAAAAPHAAKLAAAKFPADFLEQLRTAVDAVKASLATRAAHRVQGIGATRQVGSALRQGRNAVATLDALVSHLILGNDRLEREWRTAKRVVKVATRSAEEKVDAAVAGTIRPAEEAKAVTAVPSANTAPVAQEVAPTKVA